MSPQVNVPAVDAALQAVFDAFDAINATNSALVDGLPAELPFRRPLTMSEADEAALLAASDEIAAALRDPPEV